MDLSDLPPGGLNDSISFGSFDSTGGGSEEWSAGRGPQTRPVKAALTSAKNPAAAADVPVVGTGGDFLRFELALAEGDALLQQEDPFVPLSDAGRFSRVLLGRIAGGKGGTLIPLAVKIQRSSYRPSGSGARKEDLTNLQLKEMWRREQKNLARCAGTDVVSLLDLGEESFASRPVTFCRKVQAYFHPPCPQCRSLLEDCKDDALLRDHGLPEYGSTATRYLHCRACARSGAGPKIFYTAGTPAEERLKGRAEVRRRGELYRDFAAIFREKLPEEERQRLARRFPCAGCPHREECYPASAGAGQPVPAETRLTPLSYYEFHMLPLQACELHYDEFADLLGGASWEAVRARARQRGGPGRETLLVRLDEVFASPFQWLYRGEGAARFALEVLRLKIVLFSQLCRALREYHARCREPHLDLDPSKVMVRPGEAGRGLPARWNFRVKLGGVASPRRLPTDEGPELLVPSPDADKTFLSPLLRETEFGREEPMRVSVQSVQAEGPRVRLEGTVSSDRARLDAFLPGDVIRVIPSSAKGPLEGLTFWGVLGERQDRGVRFTTLLGEGTVGAAASVKPQEFDAGVAFFRRFHVPCDLYPLGLLLLRTLLVNDERDLFSVDDALQRVLKKLTLWLEERDLPAGPKVAAQVRALLEGEEDVFNPSSILYAREERKDLRAAVPARLWSDLLLLAFKLVTCVSGFSVCAHHADYPAERPEEVLDRVLAELGELETRADVELFSRAARDGDIFDACRELTAELSGPAGP